MRRACKGILLVLAGLALVAVGQEASFVPVNARMFRMRQPDGTVRIFVRDEDEPKLLHGEGGWTAELDGRQTLAMNDAVKPQDRRGFLFVNGYLRKQLVGEREANVRVPPLVNDPAALAGRWPDKDSRLVAAEAPDIWSGGERLRLWFGNPNRAGLLFAELSLAALALVFLSQLWLRILGGILFLAAFAGLVLTSSRGALLALLCGLAAMGLVRLRSLLTVRRMLLMLAAVGVAVGCLFAVGQGERLVKNLFKEGQRETSRLPVWKEVPRMMADAPGGWGLGQSARAYIDWYQPKSVCLLKDLISGHLTVLVEVGWVARFAYVFLWLAVGFLCAWLAVRGASPFPLALVVAFAVAACFNPVIAVLELWVIPLVAILTLAVRRFRECLSRDVAVLAAVAGLCAAVMVGGAFAWGKSAASGMSIFKNGRTVCFNGKSPSVWIADDDYTLHGGYWWLGGRELRDGLAQKAANCTVGYVRSVADLPSEAETIILVGETGRDFMALEKKPKAKKVVFISPPFPWQSVSASLLSSCDVSLVAGALAARRATGTEPKPSWVTIIPGAELFIPNWSDFVL